MKKPLEIPKKYTDMVGTKQRFSGGLFSQNKEVAETEFNVLNIRFATARVINVEELRKTGKSSINHPTFELLLKNDKMKKSQWSRPFPIREINLKGDY